MRLYVVFERSHSEGLRVDSPTTGYKAASEQEQVKKRKNATNGYTKAFFDFKVVV